MDVGYEARSVVLAITGTSDPGTVDVEMSYTVAYSEIQWDSFYGPDLSPDHYVGVWNGTALTLMQGDVKAVFFRHRHDHRRHLGRPRCGQCVFSGVVHLGERIHTAETDDDSDLGTWTA